MCRPTLLVCLALTWLTSRISHGAVTNKFASKNAYNASFGSDHIETKTDTSTDCHAVQVIAVLRHGSRYPGMPDINNIAHMVARLRNHTVDATMLEQLQSAVDKLPASLANELAPSGRQEHGEIGARLAKTYHNLFSPTGHQAEVMLAATSKKRTVDSQNGFWEGFSAAGTNVHQTTVVRDDLLRFYDKCGKYIYMHADKATALRDAKAFADANFDKIAAKIAQHLGDSTIKLSNDEVTSIYQTAAIEVAIFGTSTWLKLLDESDLDILEYTDDVEQYYKLGYGYAINYQQSCPLVSDMFNHMDSVMQQNSSAKQGVFYFSHLETVVPLLDALGLFKDDAPLRSDNYAAQTNRQFRMSRVGPFATNVGLVLYDCGGAAGSTAGSAERYMAQVLFKEQPVKLPFCPDTLCAYSVIRKHYAEHIDQCDFQSVCSTSVASLHTAGKPLTTMLLAFTCMIFVTITSWIRE